VYFHLQSEIRQRWLQGVVGFVVTVIEGFRINMDIVMDSDTGLNLEKENETVVATMMEMKQLFAAVAVGYELG